MRAERWRACRGGGYGGRGSGERGKRQYALTEAQLTQPICRDGGGGRGAALGEMETVAVRWSAREATTEVMLCSAARLHCCEWRRRKQCKAKSKCGRHGRALGGDKVRSGPTQLPWAGHRRCVAILVSTRRPTSEAGRPPKNGRFQTSAPRCKPDRAISR